MNTSDIEKNLLITREKVESISKLHNDLEKMWQPVIDNLDNMTEEQIGKILKETNYFQAGFHITIREYFRRKFGP